MRCIAIDHKRKLVWAGTEQGGITSFNGTKWRTWTKDNSPLPSTYIRCMALDSVNNTLWVGTRGAGAVAVKDYHLLLSTGDAPTQATYSVYPNPAQDRFTISGTSMIRSVEIYNQVGERVLQVSSGQAKTEIDMSAFPAGIYVARIHSDYSVYNRKIIID